MASHVSGTGGMFLGGNLSSPSRACAPPTPSNTNVQASSFALRAFGCGFKSALAAGYAFRTLSVVGTSRSQVPRNCSFSVIAPPLPVSAPYTGAHGVVKVSCGVISTVGHSIRELDDARYLPGHRRARGVVVRIDGSWGRHFDAWLSRLPAALLLVSQAVARLRLAHARERELARRDALTGAPNARAFYELAGAEIARARRYIHPFSVAYLDLDDFKLVNDRLGHLAGDAVLRSVARALGGVLRASDVVARLGGDEFAVLLPEAGAAPARLATDKLRQALAEVVPA